MAIGISLRMLMVAGQAGGTAPTAPSALTATADGGYQRIDLTWTDNSDDEDNFELQYDTDSGFGSPTTVEPAANATSYEVSGLARGTQYFFRIRAVNASGNSAWSATANATTFDFDDITTLKLLLLSDTGLYTDAGKTTPVANDGDLVYVWEDQSANGFDVIQATSTKRPTYRPNEFFNGKPGLEFDGGDVLQNGTVANWKFLHDGSDWVAFVIWQGANQSDGIKALFGNNGTSSASIGVSFWHDDRSSASRNNRGILQITKGSSGFPIIDLNNANLNAGGWSIASPGYDNGNAGNDAGIRAFLTNAGGAVDTTNTPHSAANPTYGLDIGALGNEVAPMTGDIAAVVMYQVTPAIADVQKVFECLADIFGLYLPFDYNIEVATAISDSSNYDFLPVSVVADDGDVVVMYRRGTIHDVETAGKITKSIYNGSTWATTDIVDSATHDDRNTGGGKAPATGTIMLFYGRYDVGGAAWFDIRALRSTDNGDTFTDVGAMNVGTDTAFSPYGPLVELPSGKLVQTFNGNDGTNYRIWASFSTDDGLTWGSEVTIATSTTIQLTEPSAVYVSGATDGAAEVLVVTRTDNGGLRQYSSTDGGATWSNDGAMPFTQGVGSDVSPYLYKYGEMIVLAYADRTDDNIKFSARAVASTITDLTAWQAPARSVAKRAAGGDIHFGYPNIIEYGGQLELLWHDTSSSNTTTPNIKYTW